MKKFFGKVTGWFRGLDKTSKLVASLHTAAIFFLSLAVILGVGPIAAIVYGFLIGYNGYSLYSLFQRTKGTEKMEGKFEVSEDEKQSVLENLTETPEYENILQQIDDHYRNNQDFSEVFANVDKKDKEGRHAHKEV